MRLSTRSWWTPWLPVRDGDFVGALGVFDVTEVNASTFTENRAIYGGAIFASWDGGYLFGLEGTAGEGDLLTVDASTFAENNALSVGGAIATDADIRITNSTLAGNSAGEAGGALAAYDSHAMLIHTTLDDNSAPEAGHADLAGDSVLYATASVFGKFDGTSACTLVDTATVTGEYNFDTSGECTDSATTFGVGQDTKLAELGDWGGPTATLLPEADSPLIDAFPLAESIGMVVDQRGAARPAGAGYDVGSVETSVLTFTIETDAGTIQGTVSGATSVSHVTWVTTADAGPGAPAGVAFPFGVSGFTLGVPVEGASAIVTLTLPAPVDQLWKVQGGIWTLVSSATFAGVDVSYVLTDGGDEAIDQIVRAAAGHLSQAIVTLILLLAPEVIVLGGGLVTAMPDLFIDEVRKRTQKRILPSFRDVYKIVVAELGDEAGVMGAAAWARTMIESKP